LGSENWQPIIFGNAHRSGWSLATEGGLTPTGSRPEAPAGVIGNAVSTMRIANIEQPTNARLCFQVSN
jgi:hypothetical protein